MERNDGSIERAQKGIEDAKESALKGIKEAEKILHAVEFYNESEKNMPVLPVLPVSPYPDANQAAEFIMRFWGISENPPDIPFAMKVFVVKYPSSNKEVFKEVLWAFVANESMLISSGHIFSLRPDIKKKFKKFSK